MWSVDRMFESNFKLTFVASELALPSWYIRRWVCKPDCLRFDSSSVYLSLQKLSFPDTVTALM